MELMLHRVGLVQVLIGFGGCLFDFFFLFIKFYLVWQLFIHIVSGLDVLLSKFVL